MNTETTPTRQETCADRLPEHLASRLDDFRTMTAREDPDEAPDDIDEPGPLDEYALGASVKYALRVDLSTGGPADYLTATVDRDGTVERITYHFADWFDHAAQDLADADFDAAEAFIEALYGGELGYFLGMELRGEGSPR